MGWQVSTGQELRTLQGHSYGVYSVAFSPDGRMLQSRAYREVLYWVVATGQQATEEEFQRASKGDGTEVDVYEVDRDGGALQVQGAIGWTSDAPGVRQAKRRGEYICAFCS